MDNSKYFEINKRLWNERTLAHVQSQFYDNESFINGRNTLGEIELSSLGDVSGKSIIHLQCHFGQDSMSLARMGASVTGVDISDAAIKKAVELNNSLGLDVEFICCNVYDTLEHINQQYDIVFVSYGATCWLPDLDNWAKVVSGCLKPDGLLYYLEFHPSFYMIDDKTKTIAYDYFNIGVQIEKHTGSYTENGEEISLEECFWQHSLSEITSSLINQNMRIENIMEYDYSPYNCFENMVEQSPGKYVLDLDRIRIPHVLELQVIKNHIK